MNGEPKGRDTTTIERTRDAAEHLRAARDRMVRASLDTVDGVRAYRAWRAADRGDAAARRMRYALETLAAADALRVEAGEHGISNLKSQISNLREAREGVMSEVADPHTLPRTEQLRRAFIAATIGGEPPSVASEVRRVLDGLRSAKTSEGTVNVLELLTSSRVDFGTKAAWFERQVLPRIAFLDGRDRDEARRQMEESLRRMEEQREQQTEEQPAAPPPMDVPPPSEDSIQPTMDAMERGGEGRGYFTVTQFFGGYFEEQAFDRFDTQQLRWVRSAPRAMQPLTPTTLRAGKQRTECGIAVPGRRIDLPLPTGWGVAASGVLPEGIALEEDANGHVVIDATAAETPAVLALPVGPRHAARPSDPPPPVGRGSERGWGVSERTPTFGAAAESFLADLARDPSLTPRDRARRCKAFTKKMLEYSNDETLNAVYLGGDPAGYFQRIEQHKKADCDVGNTYCAGLLLRLGVAHELVKGHYVKTKDPKGAASLGSGTRHAWLRVWDAATRQWEKVDATPPGDPGMDDEEMDERKPDDSAFEGDFGEQEAELLTDEELAERQRDAEAKERAQQRTPEEQADIAFAEEVGCTPEEAKHTRAAIERARGIRDKQGKRIRDQLIAQFSRIVRDNLKETTRYREPARLSEGEDLEDPVDLMVDLTAGEPDPTGFGLEEQREVREQVYDGIDLVLVCDKSASMAQTDTSTGKARAESQQEVVFLAADALLGVLGDTLRRHRARLIAPLGVRVGVVSFRDRGATVELPLTGEWGPKEQYALWSKLRRDIGGGTPDHLGMAAAHRVIARESASEAIPGRGTAVSSRAAKDRIRVVLEYSDGESDDPAAFQRSVERIRKEGIVVDTYRKDLAGFPDFVGAQVIAAVQKLHPTRVWRR